MADEQSGDGVTREDVLKAFDELREKLKLPSPESLEERKQELRRQAREILEKYKSDKGAKP